MQGLCDDSGCAQHVHEQYLPSSQEGAEEYPDAMKVKGYEVERRVQDSIRAVERKERG